MTRAPLAVALLLAQLASAPPATLPAPAVAQLQQSLEASRPHATHVWRDVAPMNADGTINAYIEIGRGDRRKWELNMARHQRAVDRVMPDYPGGYPINYGIVPQTVSYDGDPFDVLVTGAPIEGGRLVRGVIVGLMHMEDEKGLDSKVVISRIDASGRPVGSLSAADQERVGAFFNVYKIHEPGKYSRVPGWGTAAHGLAFVTTTHAFFRECRSTPARSPCTLRTGR
jgi:inorganic pyrophosphatase